MPTAPPELDLDPRTVALILAADAGDDAAVERLRALTDDEIAELFGDADTFSDDQPRGDADNAGHFAKTNGGTESKGEKVKLKVPSPESPGVYYRIQYARDPLSADWKSKNIQDEDKEEKGTSAVHSLPQLVSWARQFGVAPSGKVEIIAFRGERVGTGDDGEPVVIPEQELARYGHDGWNARGWKNLENKLRSGDDSEIGNYLSSEGWKHAEPQEVEGGEKPEDIRHDDDAGELSDDDLKQMAEFAALPKGQDGTWTSGNRIYTRSGGKTTWKSANPKQKATPKAKVAKPAEAAPGAAPPIPTPEFGPGTPPGPVAEPAATPVAPKPTAPAKPAKEAKPDPKSTHAAIAAALKDPSTLTPESASEHVKAFGKLDGKQQQALAKELGIGASGTKAQRAKRLMDHAAKKMAAAEAAKAPPVDHIADLVNAVKNHAGDSKALQKTLDGMDVAHKAAARKALGIASNQSLLKHAEKLHAAKGAAKPAEPAAEPATPEASKPAPKPTDPAAVKPPATLPHPEKSTVASLPTDEQIKKAKKTKLGDNAGGQAAGISKITIDGRDYFTKQPHEKDGPKREQLASEFAKEAGVNVPASRAVGKKGVVTDWVDGKSLRELPHSERDEKLNSIDPKTISKHVLFDYATGNVDSRNPGNYLLTPNGDVAAIDKEYAFSPPGQLGSYYSGNDALLKGSKYKGKDGVDFNFDPEELNHAIGYTETMASQLAASGHTKESEGVKKRLADLKKLRDSKDLSVKSLMKIAPPDLSE